MTWSEDSPELPAMEHPRKKRVGPSRLNICREKLRDCGRGWASFHEDREG